MIYNYGAHWNAPIQREVNFATTTMKHVAIDDLKDLYVPPRGSHKGQNGRLLVIGGSHLFHAASLWALTVASRIVDLVHYSSVPENNEIVQKAKEEFRNGIVVPREDIENYIKEDDVILIGPGMVRAEESKVPGLAARAGKSIGEIGDIREIGEIRDEGEQTAALTNYLLAKYPQKQWVIDAGALQMMDITLIPKNAILTPHQGEFEILKSKVESRKSIKSLEIAGVEDQVKLFAKEYQCIVLLKGAQDIASNGEEVRIIEGGNAGMTKGGTGDVLVGLIAALVCKNDPFPATIAGSFINKMAGEALYKKVGPYFHASDLANEIPVTMKTLLISS